MEGDLRLKTTLDERCPEMEDDLIGNTTLEGIQPEMEDNYRWKKTLMEETLDGRRHLKLY